MLFVVEIDREKIIENLKIYITGSIRFMYSWFTHDGEVLGYILAVFHMMISSSVIFMVILSHTLYPNFYFQLLTFVFLFIIWIHHIVLNVCIYVIAEINLTQNISPYYELLNRILKSYNITPDEFIRYFMITETVGVGCFGLEIISRCFHYFFKFIKN